MYSVSANASQVTICIASYIPHWTIYISYPVILTITQNECIVQNLAGDIMCIVWCRTGGTINIFRFASFAQKGTTHVSHRNICATKNQKCIVSSCMRHRGTTNKSSRIVTPSEYYVLYHIFGGTPYISYCIKYAIGKRYEP